MLKLWGMRSNPSLPSFPAPLWLRVVAPDSVHVIHPYSSINTATAWKKSLFFNQKEET